MTSTVRPIAYDAMSIDTHEQDIIIIIIFFLLLGLLWLLLYITG